MGFFFIISLVCLHLQIPGLGHEDLSTGICSNRIRLTEVSLISAAVDLTFDSAFSNSLSNYVHCS